MKSRAVLLGILYGCSLCLAQTAPPPSNAAVIIDGHVITKEEVFDLFVKRYKEQAYEAIQELMLRWIIREEAKREGIIIEVALLRQMMQEEVAKAKGEIQKKPGQSWEGYLKSQNLTEKKFREESYMKWKYKLALERLIRLSEYRETRVEARHIVVKTREKAGEILGKLKQQADFAALARQESVSETGRAGGMLPVIFRGDIYTSLEEALFRLKPYEISDVVESPGGFHILQLLKVIPGKKGASWPELQAEVMESLGKTPMVPRDIQRWLKKVEAKYTIQQMFR